MFTEWSAVRVPDSPGAIALARYRDFLYAAGGDTLAIYDVSDPGKPHLLRKKHGFGNARQLEVSGDTLYLTAREFGLWIVSLKNPRNPVVQNRVDTMELATGIAVAKKIVFVTHRIHGVEILDCSDPLHPRHLSRVKTPEAQSAAYADGILYVGDWCAAQVTSVDVRDPAHPRVLRTSPLGGLGDGVAASGGLLFAATGLNAKHKAKIELTGDGHGLDIFRIGSAGLTHLSRIQFPLLNVKTNDFWTVAVSGKYAAVADTHNGVFLVDAANPEKPVCSGRVVLPLISRMDARASGRVRIEVPDCAGDVAFGRNVLYIAGQKTGLHVAEYQGLAPEEKMEFPPLAVPSRSGEEEAEIPGFLSVRTGGQVRRLALDGDMLYAACSHAGLLQYRLTEDSMEKTARIPVPCSCGVAVRAGKLYSAEGTDGLAVYSIRDNFKELGRWKRSGKTIQILHISGDGRFAVCGSRDGILRIFDVSDPAAIRLVLRHLHGGLLYGDTFPESELDGLMPVLWPYCGIAWYNLSGKKPEIVYNDHSNLEFGQDEGIIRFREGFLATTAKKTFQFLIPHRGGQETERRILEGGGCSGVPSVNGDYAAFSNRMTGEVQLWRFPETGGAERIAARCVSGLTGMPDRIVFYRNRMLIPCGFQGILMEKTAHGNLK